MNSEDRFKELVEELGSEKKAKAALRAQDRRMAPLDLTPLQKEILDYIKSGQPIIGQRQFARAVGLDHPQKLVAGLAALVIKGYLVPKEENDYHH